MRLISIWTAPFPVFRRNRQPDAGRNSVITRWEVAEAEKMCLFNTEFIKHTEKVVTFNIKETFFKP